MLKLLTVALVLGLPAHAEDVLARTLFQKSLDSQVLENEYKEAADRDPDAAQKYEEQRTKTEDYLKAYTHYTNCRNGDQPDSNDCVSH